MKHGYIAIYVGEEVIDFVNILHNKLKSYGRVFICHIGTVYCIQCYFDDKAKDLYIYTMLHDVSSHRVTCLCTERQRSPQILDTSEAVQLVLCYNNTQSEFIQMFNSELQRLGMKLNVANKQTRTYLWNFELAYANLFRYIVGAYRYCKGLSDWDWRVTLMYPDKTVDF